MSDYSEGYTDGLKAALNLAELAQSLGASSEAVVTAINQLIETRKQTNGNTN